VRRFDPAAFAGAFIDLYARVSHPVVPAWAGTRR
jgi:hypothetical protein